jgi:hypothetical protein
MRTGTGLLIALAISAAAAAPARAENHAWSAGKKVLIGGQQMVVIANFAAIHDSQLFQTMWPVFLAQHKEAATMLGKTKQTCGLEPMQTIDSVVLAMQSMDANSDAAVFVVSLKGATQKEVDSCITKLEKGETGKKVSITTADGITTYDTGADQLYMRWLDKSTLVFSAAGKDNLVKQTKGGLASDKAVAAGLSGIKGDAALAVIYNGTMPLDQVAPGAKASLAYGSATLVKGNVGVDAHLVVDNAKTATDIVTKMNKQLADVRGSSAIPAQLTALVKSVAIKSAGAEIVVTAAAAEKEVLGLITMAMGGTGP